MKLQEINLILLVKSINKISAYNDVVVNSNFSPNYGRSSDDHIEIEDIKREENNKKETKSTNKQLMSGFSHNTSHQIEYYSNLDIEHIDKAIKSPRISPTQSRTGLRRWS